MSAQKHIPTRAAADVLRIALATTRDEPTRERIREAMDRLSCGRALCLCDDCERARAWARRKP